MTTFELWQQRLEQLKANRLFEWIVVSIIILSALLIGVQTYDNIDPKWISVLEVADFAVTIFFLVEISIRFLAEKNKKDFFKNGWNLFDTTIVVLSLIPLDGGDMAVLGRLLRIFRVLRMVSMIPELRMLLNSLLKALPQLGYVLMLMFIIFYIYAAIGSTIFSEGTSVENGGSGLWENINIALLTLFRIMTFEDWTDVMYETMTFSPYSWIYYLTFIFFTAFAFLNMVIGIVVNVMEDERRQLYEEEHKDEPTIETLHDEIQELKAMIARLEK